MKSKLLVNRYHAREVTNPDEQERLLAQGWLIAKPKAKTKDAAAKRVTRSRLRAEGWLALTLWLDPEQAALVKGALLPGESYVELLTRLIKRQSLL